MTDQPRMTKAEFFTNLNREWDRLQAFIAGLTPQQLTQPTDAAGWTVKDHLYHLAVWNIGLLALLNRESQAQAMNVDEDIWKSRDFDRINAVIFAATKHLSLDHALAALKDTHQRVYAKLQSMSEDEFHLPISAYRPHSTSTSPVIGWIIGNTYEHYDEHIPWMSAIAANG